MKQKVVENGVIWETELARQIFMAGCHHRGKDLAR